MSKYKAGDCLFAGYLVAAGMGKGGIMKYFLASLLSASVMLAVFLLISTATTICFGVEELLRKKPIGKNRQPPV